MNTRSQSGQVLLIIILLSTVLLTIGLSVSQITTQETQIAKLEEQSKKAFAAAEAGLDARLKSATDITNIALILPSDSGIISGQATLDETPKTTFITPLLKKDEQYTFYLADYPSLTNSFANNLTVYYGSSPLSCSDVSLELTIIYGTSPYNLTRYIADTGDHLGSEIDDIGQTPGGTLEGIVFNCKTSAINVGAYSDAKLILIRVLSPLSDLTTKIGFEGSANLKLQGKTITSSATTSTGVSKKIQLFQSYPQIPADFFVTSF